MAKVFCVYGAASESTTWNAIQQKLEAQGHEVTRYSVIRDFSPDEVQKKIIQDIEGGTDQPIAVLCEDPIHEHFSANHNGLEFLQNLAEQAERPIASIILAKAPPAILRALASANNIKVVDVNGLKLDAKEHGLNKLAQMVKDATAQQRKPEATTGIT